MPEEGTDSAVREFIYFIASVYRPATSEKKKMLSDINKTLCGIYHFLKRRKSLRKWRRETLYHLRKRIVFFFWATTPNRNLTRRKELQRWGTYVINCDVCCQTI